VTSPQSDSPLVIAYVLAAGHSGSTLLSLLLNAHSRIHALSEIDKLGRVVRDPARSARRLQTPHWQAVRAEYERASGRPLAQIELRRAHAGDLVTWAESYTRLAEAVARVSGKRVLVDASKDAAQLDALLRGTRLDVRVIELVRDGRGVAHSYARKYGSFARGLRHWAGNGRAAERLRARVAPERWLRVHYEDLARAPEQELARVCALLGVAFEPSMLAFRSAAWEGIAGNRVSKDAGERIELDERWRSALSWRQRALFAVLGARRNARNGY
jgi:hypothetical protein